MTEQFWQRDLRELSRDVLEDLHIAAISDGRWEKAQAVEAEVKRREGDDSALLSLMQQFRRIEQTHP